MTSVEFVKTAAANSDLTQKEVKAACDVIENTIILKYSNLTKEELDGWRDRKIDKYFSADEALKYKITDEVM